jgi:hypothetical protein
MAIKYIHLHLPLQDPPKFIQIWMFCLKIYHLATLLVCMYIDTYILTYIHTNIHRYVGTGANPTSKQNDNVYSSVLLRFQSFHGQRYLDFAQSDMSCHLFSKEIKLMYAAQTITFCFVKISLAR